jgi:chorismate mutase/prephenate dehydratase
MSEKQIPSLDVSREKIDRIDRELVKLFCERMQVSADVAEYKRTVGKPITDAARERALLAKVSDLAGTEMEDYTRTLYATVLSISKAYQHERLNTSSKLKEKIEKAKDVTLDVAEKAVDALRKLLRPEQDTDESE